MSGRRGWFADVDGEAPTGFPWQPCLETGLGLVPCFELWFKTEAECEAWIRDNVLGVGMFDDTEARP